MIACLLGQLDDAFRPLYVHPDFDPLTVVKFLAIAAIVGVAGVVAALRRNRFAALVCGLIAIVPALAYLAWSGYLVFGLEQWQEGNAICLGTALVTAIAGGVAVRLALLVPQQPR